MSAAEQPTATVALRPSLLTALPQLLLAAAIATCAYQIHLDRGDSPPRPASAAEAKGAPPKQEASPKARSLADMGPTQTAELVPFGPGRALYNDGRGRFLIIASSEVDSSVVVERALSLIQDPRRHHEDPRRTTHGYYLDDLAESRKGARGSLRGELESLIQSGQDDVTAFRRAEDLCARLAALHDVPWLLPLLKHERFFIRRAAAVALGEQGYLAAIPELGFSLSTGDDAFRARLGGMLEDLIGEALVSDPADKEQAQARARIEVWWRDHRPGSRFALGRRWKRTLERRLER
jgi:hypothetical protein